MQYLEMILEASTSPPKKGTSTSRCHGRRGSTRRRTCGQAALCQRGCRNRIRIRPRQSFTTWKKRQIARGSASPPAPARRSGMACFFSCSHRQSGFWKRLAAVRPKASQAAAAVVWNSAGDDVALDGEFSSILSSLLFCVCFVSLSFSKEKKGACGD